MNNNEFGASLAKDTLTGDIAAYLIDRLRAFPKPYRQMSEREQGEQIEMAKTAARELVNKAVNIVASGGRKTVQAEMGKITVDKGLKCEIKASVAYADELIAVAGKPILIVTNSDDEFTGGEDNLRPDPDQREMFNNCNREYQDADGEGIPDPAPGTVGNLPALEDHSVVDAESEEVEEVDSGDNEEEESEETKEANSGNDEEEKSEESAEDPFAAEEAAFNAPADEANVA